MLPKTIRNNYKKEIQLSAMLLLLVHSFIFFSYTFFLHYHTLENGTRVLHSHPFSSQNDNNNETNHQHNAGDYHLLPDLNDYNYTLSFRLEQIISEAGQYIVKPFLKYQSEHEQFSFLRGPPNLIFI